MIYIYIHTEEGVRNFLVFAGQNTLCKESKGMIFSKKLTNPIPMMKMTVLKNSDCTAIFIPLSRILIK